jgi:hypothetical protein
MGMLTGTASLPARIGLLIGKFLLEGSSEPMFIPIRTLLLTLAFCTCVNSSFGAIIVSYQGGSITAGGTGFVDVMVSSNAAPGTPDFLDAFSAHFLITPLGGAVANGLQFVNPQSDSQLGMGNYVFAGNSLTPPPIGAVSTATNANDTYIGGDATLNAIPVGLNNTQSPFLLFRLDLSAALANVGDQFTIQLQSGQFYSDLTDPLSELPITGSFAGSDGSFTPFTITAVPEPTSTGVLLVGTGIGIWLKRRRKLQRQNCCK